MTTQSVHPQVLNGRNPWWREAWGELPPQERRSIQAALKRGERVPDHRLPFVYGLLAIERRRLRWMPLRFLWAEALAGVWVYFHCFRTLTYWCLMFAAIAAAGGVAFGVGLILLRRRVIRAEKANLWGRP